MAKEVDEVVESVRAAFAQADHFKNLWLQANEELERARQANATLFAQQVRARTALQEYAQSYEQMSRDTDGHGKVMCSSVAADIKRNMVPMLDAFLPNVKQIGVQTLGEIYPLFSVEKP